MIFIILVTFIKNGNMHIIDTIEKIEWASITIKLFSVLVQKNIKNCFEDHARNDSKDQLLKI